MYDKNPPENGGFVSKAVLAFFCKFEFSMIKYSVLWAGRGCIFNRVNGNNLQYKIKGDNKS